MTSSLVVPCVHCLTAQLNQLSSMYNCKLVGALKFSFTKRMAVFAQKVTYILATSLGPRFELTWTHGDEIEKYTADLVSKVCQTSRAATSTCSAAEADDTTAPPPKRPRWTQTSWTCLWHHNLLLPSLWHHHQCIWRFRSICSSQCWRDRKIG